MAQDLHKWQNRRAFAQEKFDSCFHILTQGTILGFQEKAEKKTALWASIFSACNTIVREIEDQEK